MMNWRNAEEGTYANQPTYCTVNCRGTHDCPYSDENGICHAPDPIVSCEDFSAFFANWDDWLALGEDVPDDYDEMGYDPFAGSYTYDC